jgi:hypothetical protein
MLCKNFAKLIYPSITIFFGCLIFNSCSKEDSEIDELNRDEMVVICETIATQADDIIENAIQRAVDENSTLDPGKVADALRELELVRSATPSETGTSITIEQTDGTTANVLLVPWQDERMFIIDSSEIIVSTEFPEPGPVTLFKNSLDLAERPAGDKALILAPFQHQFNEKLSDYESKLTAIGYKVTKHENQAANVSRFRCEYLQQFDVIIVSTHGTVGKTIDKNQSTLLLTGERVSPATISAYDALSREEKNALGIQYVKGVPYFAVSVQFLELTKKGEFPASWFCASACESSKIDFGSTSLSAFLLNNGVGGFTGYDDPVYNPTAASILEQLLNYLASGNSLKEASTTIKSDWKFRIAVRVRIFSWSAAAEIDLLDAHVRLNEPFYITRENPFPYNHCRFNFFSRASYNSSSTGSYDFAFSREVEAFGNLNGNRFTGSYTITSGSKTIEETIDITLDLANHLITEFTISGNERVSDEENLSWQIKNSDTDFSLNATNGYGYATGTDVGKYVGNVMYESVYTSEGTSVTHTLTGINYDADSELEFQFSELGE